MSYSIKKISLDQAYQKIEHYDYALVYMFSSVILCKTENLDDTDWEECLEARFFSERAELHLFERDGDMQAVEIADDGSDKDTFIKKYQLDSKFAAMGRNIYVKEYLDYDEDGQINVSLTRLCGIGR